MGLVGYDVDEKSSARHVRAPGAQDASVAEQAGRQNSGLRPSLQAKFGEQAGDVVLDGFLGQEQVLPDLPVGHAVGDAGQDLALLLGQRGQLVRRLRSIPDPLQHSGDEGWSSSDWPAATRRMPSTRSVPWICLST